MPLLSVYGYRVINVKYHGVDSANTPSDNSDGFAAAMAEAATLKYPVYVPATDDPYEIDDTIIVPDGVTIFGDGWHSKIKQTAREQNVVALGHYSTARGLHVIGDNDAVLANAQLNNGIIAVNKKGVCIENNFIEQCESASIHIAGCYDFKVQDNYSFGYTWNLTVQGGSSADIVCYGGTAGARGIISRNHCLSNHSSGIYVNVLGNENDLIISDNICVTLDPATCIEGGTWAEIATPNKRHAIVTSYTAGANQCRVTVTGNICRNTQWSGIYVQGGDTGANRGPILVANNFCSKNGVATSDPSLSGGIWVRCWGNEIIDGNVIIEYQYTGQSASGGLTIIATPNANTLPSVFRNNWIKGCLGLGAFISGKGSRVALIGNTFIGNAKDDIGWEATSGDEAVGGHIIQNNLFIKTQGPTYACISFNPQIGADPMVIRDNVFLGFDNTTANDDNTAIRIAQISGLSLIKTHVYGNHIKKFRYGISIVNYITAGRHFDVIFDRNVISDCFVGIGAGSGGSTATFPVEGNRFINCTSRLGVPATLGGFSCLYEVVRLDGTMTVVTTSAAPTQGTWAQGDKCWYSSLTAGSSPGSGCVSGGTPGTWKAMPALAA